MGKYCLEDAQSLAKEKGGECLSTEYVNSATKISWRCGGEHEWETTFSKVKNDGSWCPRCQFDKKMCSLEDAQRIAQEKGGECLSETYTDIKSKLSWRCKEMHEWEATLDGVKNKNAWCRRCYDIAKHCGLEEAQDAAKKRGGKCLSTTYVNMREKMTWECCRGHTWSAQYDGIKRGKWCPICDKINRTRGKELLSVETAKTLAAEKGGKCLSTDYKNCRIKLRWECKRGHQWDAPLESIRLLNTWCNKCAIIKLSNTIEDAQRLAEKKGGECLSTEYVNAEKHLKWKCRKGHEWTTAYACVRDGKWCPYCPFKSETVCRELFEKLFEKKFPKKRPEFLTLKNGQKLELDGYNEELEVAFEYQGKQHYEWCTIFHKTEKDFKMQQKRDRHKYRLCQENNIALILIPYKFTHKDPLQMEDFIADQLLVQGIVGEIVTETEIIFHDT